MYYHRFIIDFWTPPKYTLKIGCIVCSILCSKDEIGTKEQRDGPMQSPLKIPLVSCRIVIEPLEFGISQHRAAVISNCLATHTPTYLVHRKQCPHHCTTHIRRLRRFVVSPVAKTECERRNPPFEFSMLCSLAFCCCRCCVPGALVFEQYYEHKVHGAAGPCGV
jgi:hypothetical protein